MASSANPNCSVEHQRQQRCRGEAKVQPAIMAERRQGFRQGTADQKIERGGEHHFRFRPDMPCHQPCLGRGYCLSRPPVHGAGGDGQRRHDDDHRHRDINGLRQRCGKEGRGNRDRHLYHRGADAAAQRDHGEAYRQAEEATAHQVDAEPEQRRPNLRWRATDC